MFFSIFAAGFFISFAGLTGLVIRPASVGQKLATLISCCASLLGAASTVRLLTSQTQMTATVNWTLPFGACTVGIDPLTAFFLLPIFVVTFCGALYGLGYWPAAHHASTAPVVTFFFHLLSSSMIGVVTARNGPLFLIAWEVMALSAFFLLVTEHSRREVRDAGLVYLLTTHTGTLALFIFFAVLCHVTGTFSFPSQGALSISAPLTVALFVLALMGFGAKAGIMPLHFWLPSAHANAPSHGSAMMSGVMLKMGIYGIIRFLTFLPKIPLWFGVVVLCAGLVSALLGICSAAIQTDIKRLLAYSSIENIGIIVTGIGMAMIGKATDNPALILLGFSGAFLHVLNHSLFKPLLFFGAGGVIHSCGTRLISRMGGLAKTMRTSSVFFIIGCLAIAGLPPLNGFAGEFLLYTGFFHETLAPLPIMALGIPALGLVGGMATITFVKLYGTVFLGTARTPGASRPHELQAAMLIPMGLLTVACLIGGLVPALALKLVHPVVLMLAPSLASGSTSALLTAPLSYFPLFGTAIIVATLGVWLLLKRATRRAASAPTWGCGYLAATPRMQYTGVGFSESWASITRSISRGIPRRPALHGVIPAEAAFRFVAEETLLVKGLHPLFRTTDAAFSVLRRLQNGQLHLYVLYIFVTLVLLMVRGR